MSLEIVLTFGILVVAIVLFVTEVIRADLVALIVLVALTLTGLIQPEQALSGFSNPAVVTVWAMFILSAGLARTGVANMIGKQVLRIAGNNMGRLVAVLMTTTGLLSAFMNNIGIAALFLPITMDIARRTRQPASRLLIPMAYGSLLGGLVLLIGTASNLLVRDALREAGLRPFGIFDFAPGGLLILIVSVAYMSLIGQRFLPVRETPGPLSAANHADDRDIRTAYGLEERLASLVLPKDSPLAGKTLSESRISLALGLNVLSVQRKGKQRIPARADLELQGDDHLLILGRLDRIHEIADSPMLTIEEGLPALSWLVSDATGLAELQVGVQSVFINRTLFSLAFRQKFGLNVMAIRRGELIQRTNLQNIALQAGDRLLLQGSLNALKALENQSGFRLVGITEVQDYRLEERLLPVSIPEGSSLVGRKLKESRLGAAYGLFVLSMSQGDGLWKMPQPEITLQAGDRLLVSGHPQDIDVLKGLSTVQIDHQVDSGLDNLGDGATSIIEVMLSPFTSLSGKTLRELHFREKHGVSVLAIWRGDRAYRTDLGNIPLSYGDALLCYGPLDRFALLARDSDFVVLNTEVQEQPRLGKAPPSAAIMLSVIGAIIFLGLPVSIAAITGVVLMVLTRCLTMQEAYQGISWQSVFLIAAMLPMGVAMQQTGAALYLANAVINGVGAYGPTAILAGLMLLSMLSTQFMPSAVVAVIMSPIALSAAFNLGISPYPYMMGVAYALAASFLSPVAHPANVLVMSPGGYRFTDYFKHGLPLSIIVLAISIPLLPVLFPY